MKIKSVSAAVELTLRGSQSEEWTLNSDERRERGILKGCALMGCRNWHLLTPGPFNASQYKYNFKTIMKFEKNSI